MRNIARKTTSLALVLVLLLSAMSVAAFASNEVQPCALCRHPMMMSTTIWNVISLGSTGHRVDISTLYNCPDCGFSYEELLSSSVEPHTSTTMPCQDCGYQP